MRVVSRCHGATSIFRGLPVLGALPGVNKATEFREVRPRWVDLYATEPPLNAPRVSWMRESGLPAVSLGLEHQPSPPGDPPGLQKSKGESDTASTVNIRPKLELKCVYKIPLLFPSLAFSILLNEDVGLLQHISLFSGMDSVENLVRIVGRLDRDVHRHTKFCKKVWAVHLSR